ncbi:hypothetical protein METP3_03154 [Methanosarcinales archaeon]|nr:hypothetical protein METP3_03154 [Methanosarcinales archaeon]
MSGREKGKISIRTALQQRDAALYHRLENIWVAIAREIQERQQSKEGHQQGPLHCGMVEDNLGKLIPDDQKSNFFTPLELFLFSAAACYHDIGKSNILAEIRDALLPKLIRTNTSSSYKVIV